MIFIKSNKARGLHPMGAPSSRCTPLQDSLKILEPRLLCFIKYSRLGGYTHWVHLRCIPMENSTRDHLQPSPQAAESTRAMVRLLQNHSRRLRQVLAMEDPEEEPLADASVLKTKTGDARGLDVP